MSVVDPKVQVVITPYHDPEVIVEQLKDLPLYASTKEALRQRQKHYCLNRIRVPSCLPSIRMYADFVEYFLISYYGLSAQRDATMLTNEFIHAGADFRERSCLRGPRELSTAEREDLVAYEPYEVAYNTSFRMMQACENEELEGSFVIPFAEKEAVDFFQRVVSRLKYKIDITDMAFSD